MAAGTRCLMRTRPLLIPLFVAFTAASAATVTTHPVRITLVQSEEGSGTSEASHAHG